MKAFLGLAAAATVVVAASPSLSQVSTPDRQDRLFTIDDLVSQAAIGDVRVSPDSRWAVVERQAAWNTASTYRYDYYTKTLLTRLDVYSLADGVRAHTLDEPGRSAGFAAGPFSPSGAQMVVYRLSDTAWSLGVMTLATGTVRWFDLSPEVARFGETVVWRSETELVLAARRNGGLPFIIGVYARSIDRQTELWRRAAAGHAPSVIATPSGRRRDDRDKGAPSQLIRVDLAAGREHLLLEGPIIDIALSPDGRTIAALLDGADIQYDADTVLFTGSPKQIRRILLADLDTGAVVEPRPDQDFTSHLLSWSPRSDRLIAFGRERGGRFETGRFWLLDREGSAAAVDLGGATAWIDGDSQTIPIARASWDDAHPVFQIRTAAGEKAWLRSDQRGRSRIVPQREDGEVLARFDGTTFILRSSGLTPFGDEHVSTAHQGLFNDAGTASDFGARGASNPSPAQLEHSVLLDAQGCLRPSGGVARCLAPLGVDDRIVAASPDGEALLIRQRSSGGATRLELRTAAGSKALAAVNARLDDRDWGAVVPVDHPGPDGGPQRSWLLLPPVPSDRPPPVAVIVYPGRVFPTPPARLRPGALNLHINAAILSAAGYAVLMPSLPQEASPSSDLGLLGPELVSILQAACATDRCDPERAALIGHSFGGYGVLLAASQTEAFKAIIASNGYADLTEAYEPRLHSRLSGEAGVSIQSGWLEGGQGGLGAPLSTDPDRYVARSPLYAVDRIRTPTLLIESDFDGSRFDSIFGALYRLDREAELATYFGESHEFVSPANIRDMHLRILEWLARHLGAPTALDARLPRLRPDLERAEDKETVGGGVPDQAGLVEVMIENVGVDQALLRQSAFDQDVPDRGDALPNDQGVKPAQIALVPSLADQGRQSVVERQPRHTAIPRPQGQSVDR